MSTLCPDLFTMSGRGDALLGGWAHDVLAGVDHRRPIQPRAHVLPGRPAAGAGHRDRRAGARDPPGRRARPGPGPRGVAADPAPGHRVPGRPRLPGPPAGRGHPGGPSQGPAPGRADQPLRRPHGQPQGPSHDRAVAGAGPGHRPGRPRPRPRGRGRGTGHGAAALRRRPAAGHHAQLAARGAGRAGPRAARAFGPVPADAVGRDQPAPGLPDRRGQGRQRPRGPAAPGPQGRAAADHVAHHLQRKWAAGGAWGPHLPGKLVLVRARARLPIGPRQEGGPPMASMEGQVALVTGGARGIGLAISGRLAARGVRVAVGYSHGADTAKAFAAAHEGATIHQGNIGVAADCERVISEVLDQHGRMDILVNNAGITIDRTVRKMSVEDWDRVVHVNLSGAFYLSRAVLQHMLDRGYGRIINISSVIGEKGNIGQANYAAAKSGLFGLTNSLALETARKGITVNSFVNDSATTEMVSAMPEQVLERVIAQIPVGRLGEPDEIARVVEFLADPDSGYITGEVYGINGGLYM